MRRTIGLWVAVLATIGTLGTVITTTAEPAGAQGCGTPRVTADQPPLQNYFPVYAYDGQWASFFATEHDDWQFVQVDFGCVGTFSGISRLMTLGFTSAPNRGPQGEAVSYSVDGRSWTQVTGATSTGWEGYVNYRPHAWHSVDFGRSDELRLDVPASARYVRFHWDGAPGHFLHELYIDFTSPPVPEPLRVDLDCDAGIVLCTATASGGAGGYAFAWQPGSRTRILQQTDGPTTSSVSGTCFGGSYSVQVRVTDADGATASRNVSRSCGGLLR